MKIFNISLLIIRCFKATHTYLAQIVLIFGALCLSSYSLEFLALPCYLLGWLIFPCLPFR